MSYNWKPGYGGYNYRSMSNEYNTWPLRKTLIIRPLRETLIIRPLRESSIIQPLREPLRESSIIKENKFDKFFNYCKNGDTKNATILYDKYFKNIDDKHDVGFYKLLYNKNQDDKNGEDINEIVKEVENDEKYFNTFFNYCKNGDLENAKLWYIEHQKNNNSDFDIVELCLCINEIYENSHIDIIKFIIENNIGNILKFKSSFFPNVKNDIELLNFFENYSKNNQ